MNKLLFSLAIMGFIAVSLATITQVSPNSFISKNDIAVNPIILNEKLEDLKLEDLKLEDLKLEDVKLEDLKFIKTKENEKYIACIKDCKETISSCKKIRRMCNNRQPEMMEFKGLCKDCINACKMAIKALEANENVQTECLKCARLCDKCADECKRFKIRNSVACEANCRQSSKSCNEI